MVIIIGGGIAGLYSAYKILKINPRINLMIIERDKIGGRMGNEMFYGVRIVTGAGVGRKNKDHLLMELVKELKIPTTTFQSKHTQCSIKKTFNMLKKRFNESSPRVTFKEFALPLLGADYEKFTICSGYTDYENEDAYEVFYNYGFDDNFNDWTAVTIPWNDLLDALVKKIGPRFLFANVTKISPGLVHTDKGNYSCDKIILATTIKTVQKLLPLPIYRQIHSQPFLRVYGKFTKESALRMKNISYTVVPGPLKKIIPMNAEKGVFMIAYTDNKDAELLHLAPKEYFCKLLEIALGMKLDLIAIKEIYWKEGTHYYEPLNGFKTRREFLKRAQHPYPGILVVGEMISTKQGWVEGALESTNVITKEWLLSA